jgi:hypothetical protein
MREAVYPHLAEYVFGGIAVTRPLIIPVFIANSHLTSQPIQ